MSELNRVALSERNHQKEWVKGKKKRKEEFHVDRNIINVNNSIQLSINDR